MAAPDQIPSGYTSVAQLSYATRVPTDTIRRHLREGKIAADKPGSEWLFSAEQWTAALLYYRRWRQSQEAAAAAEAETS